MRQVNFFIILAYSGGIVLMLRRVRWQPNYVCASVTVAGLVAYIAAVAELGTPPDVFVGTGSFANSSYGGLFVTNLIAGLVTFGGAYTAIPFLQEAAVQVRACQ